MPNRINQLLLEEYKDLFKGLQNMISIGYEKLPMKKQMQMRDEMAAQGIQFCFVKNRVANIAFKELGLPDVMDICIGQTGFAYGEDPVAIARYMAAFAKANSEVKIHGGMVEATVFDEAGAKSLATSPTKEELKSQLVGQILSAGGNVVAAAMGPAQTIAGQLKARIEELEKESA